MHIEEIGVEVSYWPGQHGEDRVSSEARKIAKNALFGKLEIAPNVSQAPLTELFWTIFKRNYSRNPNLTSDLKYFNGIWAKMSSELKNRVAGRKWRASGISFPQLNSMAVAMLSLIGIFRPYK